MSSLSSICIDDALWLDLGKINFIELLLVPTFWNLRDETSRAFYIYEFAVVSSTV